MIIESATSKLALDLLQELSKFKYTVTDIRVQYSNGNTTRIETFSTLQEFVTFYNTQYSKLIVTAKTRNPFTTDPDLKQTVPLAKNGVFLGPVPQATCLVDVPGYCRLGPFASLQSFKLSSTALGFEFSHICKDVSRPSFTIVDGRSFDLRRQSQNASLVEPFKLKISTTIGYYVTVLSQIRTIYRPQDLYVDLCYVDVGYVFQSSLYYKIFYLLTGRTSTDLTPLLNINRLLNQMDFKRLEQ